MLCGAKRESQQRCGGRGPVDDYAGPHYRVDRKRKRIVQYHCLVFVCDSHTLLIEGNGLLSPHIKRLLRAMHGSTWRDRSQVEPELEVGSVVASVEPAPPRNHHQPAGTPTPTTSAAAAVPFLLRAFRRSPPVTTGNNAVVNHCIAGFHAIDEWAPVSLLHVIKALRDCDMELHGPEVIVQPTETATASADGQRFVVSQRHRHRLGRSVGDGVFEADLKCKCQVPINYPGPMSENLHLRFLRWHVRMAK